ncbi:MAG: pilus assembly protein [Rhizobium sp.]|nr:pilus assembly protein [Rhizobium sp.]
MRHLTRLLADRSGNFGLLAALAAACLTMGVGASIDYSYALTERQKIQQALDAGLLAALSKSTLQEQRTVIQNVLLANAGEGSNLLVPDFDFGANLAVAKNADGSVTATLRDTVPTTFMRIAGRNSLAIRVKSTAIAASQSSSDTCIWSLGNSGQDVLINSGATVDSTRCRLDAHSTANPAFIMNSGSTIKFTKFCVKGTKYIKNGGTLANLETGCTVAADPYAGLLPEPTLPASCTTSGYPNGNTFSLAPGMHCDVGFNGSPTITFQPGLHIIKGRMIINSGAKVIANGVTFYFPDTNSEIRANGSLTFTGTAPTTGTYKGILMFEKTSNAGNNANKTQYIFNGSNGETLEGIIYLPNRNVTYNSTTNVAAKISMVVNQIIFNSANWKIEPYDGGGSAAAKSVRLLE